MVIEGKPKDAVAFDLHLNVAKMDSKTLSTGNSAKLVKE